MKLILGGHGSGKTHRLLEWMRSAPEGQTYIMFCASQRDAHRLRKENRDIEPWRFTYAEHTAQLRDRNLHLPRVALDDLDITLSGLIGFPVDLVAANCTWVVAEPWHNPYGPPPSGWLR